MNTATGVYFDGQVARGRQVTLERTDDQQLRISGEGREAQFEVAGLRVSDRLGEVPRFIYLPADAVVETSDNAFVDALVGDRKQNRLARVIHALESLQWVAAVSCLVLVIMIAAVGFYAPPALARTLARRVPAEIDQRIGTAAIAALAPYFSPSALTPKEQARVETQLRRLLVDPNAPRPRVEFRAMNGGLPNAFALPGNVIVVTDEFMHLPAQDDEVAAVLAHELGHLDRRHGLQGLLRNSSVLLIVAAVTGDLSALTSYAATIPLTILTAGYSRDLEREADHYALDLLRARGISTRAFVTVLAKLEESRAVLQRTSTYLSTHPSTDERTALFGGIAAEERSRVLAMAWWNRAVEAASQQDHEATIAACDRVIQREPTAAAYVLRANAHAARNNFAATYADAGKALELEPELVTALLARAEGAQGMGRPGEVEEAAKKVLALAPQNAVAFMFRGYAKLMQGELLAAETDLGRAIRTIPENYRAWAYRGLARQRQNNLPGARSDYDEALERAPGTGWVHYDRGMVRSRQRDFEGALADFALVKNPVEQTPDYFLERGLAQYGAHKFDQAISDYDHALEKKPDAGRHSVLLQRRGEAYAARGNHANALADLDAAIAMNPRNVRAHVSRAMVRRMTGRFPEAMADLEHAKLNGIGEEAILLPRAEVNWDLGNYQAALRDFGRVLEKGPNAGAYRTRSLVSFALHDWPRAEADINAYLAATKPKPGEYAEFFRLLIRRHRKADDELPAFTETIRSWPDGWAHSVGLYLSQQMTEENLLAQSAWGTQPSREERLCEAYFYIGETRLLAGETAAAEEFFQKCVRTDVTTFSEYKLAKGELAHLAGR